MGTAGPDYVVSTRYQVEDASSRALRRMSAEHKSLGGEVAKLKASLAGIGAAVTAAWGSTWAVGKAKEWLVDYNEKIRSAEIGMAALISTSADFGEGTTAAERFAQSLQLAPRYMNQLRSAAAAGIGEFADYAEGFQLLLKPVLNAGGSGQNIVDMTRLLVPVAKTLQIPMQNAAMDIQQMLMGTSRSTDRLPKMLGIAADEANRLARSKPAELLSRISEKLGEWDPAAKEFGKTLGAQMDTLKDNVAQTMGALGLGVTRELGLSVEVINKWFGEHQGEIDKWVATTGRQLAAWFRTGFDYASKTVEFIRSHWDKILAGVKQMLSTWVKIKALQAGIGLVQGGVGAFQALTSMGIGGAGSGVTLLELLKSPAFSTAIKEETESLTDSMDEAKGKLDEFGEHIDPNANKGIGKGMALLGKGMAVASAALAGWEIGKLANDTLGLDDAILSETSRIAGLEYDLGMTPRQQMVADDRKINASAEKQSRDRLAKFMDAYIPGGSGAAGLLRQYTVPLETDGLRKFAEVGLEILERSGAGEKIRQGLDDRLAKLEAYVPEGSGAVGLLRQYTVPLTELGVDKIRQGIDVLLPLVEQKLYPGKREAIDTIFYGAKRLYEELLVGGGLFKGSRMAGEVAQTLTDPEMAKKLGLPAIPESMVRRAFPELYGKDAGKPDIRGKPQVTFNNARFEVKIDARDKDPDDIAVVLEDWVTRSVEYQTRSRVAPVGA